MEYDPSLLVRINWRQKESFLAAFQRRFTAADIASGGITAICSHTSLAIVDISPWLVQNGLRIFDDISLMGYGDHPFLPMLNMPCSIIGVPSYEMGKSAVDEISTALLEKRALHDVLHEVWLEKRHTVRTL